MADPRPGDPGYQEWFNKQITDHDRALREQHPDTDIADVIPPKTDG